MQSRSPLKLYVTEESGFKQKQNSQKPLIKSAFKLNKATEIVGGCYDGIHGTLEKLEVRDGLEFAHVKTKEFRIIVTRSVNIRQRRA